MVDPKPWTLPLIVAGIVVVVSVADEEEGIAPNAIRDASGLGLTMIATMADWMAVESLPLPSREKQKLPPRCHRRRLVPR